jgi:protein-tyrosine phosphatase
MIKVLFICHGNICRSPMAEFVMKDMVRRAGREKEVFVASAATSREELGHPVYPPVRRLLEQHGIESGDKAARQITEKDYGYFDLLLGMDSANIRNMTRFWGGDPMGKVHRLLDYTDCPGDVADPWYTGDFEATWRDVNAGCSALLFALISDTITDK